MKLLPSVDMSVNALSNMSFNISFRVYQLFHPHLIFLEKSTRQKRENTSKNSIEDKNISSDDVRNELREFTASEFYST